MALTKITKTKKYLEEHYHILEIDGELYAKGPKGIRKLNTYINKKYHKYGKTLEYQLVSVIDYIEKRSVNMTWHQLLYIWYKGEIPAGYDVDHIDGNTLNNDLDNLQLLSRADNLKKRKGSRVHHPVFCTETQTMYESIRDAARKTGVTECYVYASIKGQVKRQKYYHFIDGRNYNEQ